MLINAFKLLTMKNPCFAVSDYASFGLHQLALLICSIWLCRKLLCFKYLLVTGSAAYHFRQRRSRHRSRNKRPPAAEGQALWGTRLKALLALDFAYLCVAIRAIHSSRCISAGLLMNFIEVRLFSVTIRAIHLTVNMPLRILVGVHRVFPPPDP